jgi:DNA modification methylase
VGRTQEALYRDLDLELSWSERELPQRDRTKHVHGLHPYLGKFVPQLVEELLRRHFRPGQHVLDPFAGSGTTLVQALESGLDATGAEVAPFNCLLMEVKTRRYDLFRLETELRDASRRALELTAGDGRLSRYLRRWYAPQAAGELVAFRSLVSDYVHSDVLRIVLARAARSARLTPHFDLDFPRAPQRAEYWCHKHRRLCRPVTTARRFLIRYCLDTLERLKEFDRVRSPRRTANIVEGDSRTLELPRPLDGVVTSPPYPGLIDYHEQHRYAYELLDLAERRSDELGAPARGTGRTALAAYTEGVAAALENAARAVRPGGPVVIVVNDRRELYPEICERAGLRVERRLRRHVNRRTGRRAGEFYEDVLVARTPRLSRAR